jgi:dipeptidyl aminopeptidase/acylaminoacyl peptidase
MKITRRASALLVLMLTGLLAGLGVPLSSAHAQPASSAPAFGYMDTFSLEWATSPEIQPSGEHVVYIRSGMDKMKDRRTGRLWLVSQDRSMHRKLTGHEHSEYGARWSPDGTEIAYVAATEENGSEIMVYSLQTLQATRITQLETSPSDLRWSPDGSHIAFNMMVEQDPPPYEVDLPSPPEGAEWADSPTVLTRLRHEADGRGDLPHGFRHIFVVPAEGGTPRQITSGDYNHGGAVSWLPDGTGFVFSANRIDNWEYDRVESEVHLATLEGEITTLTDRDGPDGGPVVSPGGEQIAYTGFDDRVQTFQNNQLYVMNADGSGRQLLTGDLNRSVSNPIWDASGDGIYVSYLDNGLTEVARIGLDGSVEVVAETGGGVAVGRPYAGGDYSVSRDGQVAFTHGTTDDLANIAIAQPGGPDVLTDLNGDLLPHRTLGEVEEVTWDAPDGRTIHGWVVRPPEFDENEEYPLLMEIHGGPISSYGPVFSPEMQLYAAAGYVVLYANPRGSTGYTEEFANLLYHDFPGGDYGDLMAGVDMMLDQGYVDRDRMYVAGGSAGGTMTAWIVGSTNRFRAAAVHKPVMNWYSKTLVADNYYAYADYRYPGHAWENPEKYLEESPISLVGNVKTPTMVMVGTDDLRTPPSEARQLYHALKIRTIGTALVEIPGASHGIASRPSQLNAKVAYTVSWFKRYE